MSDGLTPSCSSWAASVFERRQWVAAGSAGAWPFGVAGIPQEPALRVFDQVAIVDKVHGLADIHARRPARNIARNALPAIQDVEPLDALADLAQSSICSRQDAKSCRQSEQH